MHKTLKDLGDVLLLRISGDRIRGLGWKHFALGLFITWIVGMGRWYDDTNAVLAQQLGLGSVVYIFVLSFLIWSLASPFPASKEVPWRYANVLTYVSLTAVPGIIYAFPIESMASAKASQYFNLTALTIVSVWRIAMLVRLYREGAAMKKAQTAATALVLISGIVLALSFLGVGNAILNAMGGFRNEQENLADAIAGIAFLISGPTLLISGNWYAGLKSRRYQGWPWKDETE